MRRRLVLSYLALVALALVLFTVPVAISSADLLRRTLQDTALREAELFVPLVLREDADAARAVRDRTRDFERATGSRVRLVRAGGADDPDPQVRAALAGATPAPVWGRHPALGTSAVSVVVPVRRAGTVVAAVQVVAPADAVEDEIAGIWRFRLAVGGGVLLVAAGLAVLLGRGLTRPLARLNAAARRLGEGDFDQPAPETGPAEIAAVARTLNASTRRTAVLLESQRAFVADASHQLRSPLAAMRLTLDDVREDLADLAGPDELRLGRRLDAVDGDLRRVGRLVEDLLALARAEAQQAAPAAVDLPTLVRERLALWEAAFEDAGVRAVADLPTTPLSVLVRPGAVEQILDNALDNALLVVPAGGAVTVRARTLEAHVSLAVVDDGPGLSREQAERAFDRFWTTRPGSGSGLGLAVVRHLVEQDDGQVSLRPGRDRGAVLEVRWPRCPATAGPTSSRG